MNTESVNEALNLERFFSENDHKWDLVTGTIFNQGGTRVVYLSSDVIKGVYTALEYEAGEAWKIILQNCGYKWGKRVAEHLDRELSELFKKSTTNVTVNDYVRLLEAYFVYHGWGNIKVNLENAIKHGVISINLTNSIFEQVLNDVDGHVDQMIEGMLRSQFEHISGCELDCVQISSVRDGADSCEFIISAPDRIEKTRAKVEEKASRESIYELILG